MDFVDILRAGRPGGEPSILRSHLDPTECGAVTRSRTKFFADLFSGKCLNVDLSRRQRLQQHLLVGCGRGVYPRMERHSQLVGEMIVEFAWLALGLCSHFG